MDVDVYLVMSEITRPMIRQLLTHMAKGYSGKIMKSNDGLALEIRIQPHEVPINRCCGWAFRASFSYLGIDLPTMAQRMVGTSAMAVNWIV